MPVHAQIDAAAPCPHIDHMHRTDRLYDLIQILRDGRLHRASEMADRLGVSVRTLWRDMATLMASGLPVEGERGVGYILRSPITLPPMILTGAELEALRAGVRLVAAGSDPALARAARDLATKIASVTPAPPEGDTGDLFAFTGHEAKRAAPHMPLLRQAIRMAERLTITYIEPTGHETHADICPLALERAGRISTLIAWCEARGDFRTLRVDRIVVLAETGEICPPDPARSLAAFRALQGDAAKQAL